MSIYRCIICYTVRDSGERARWGEWKADKDGGGWDITGSLLILQYAHISTHLLEESHYETLTENLTITG